MLAVLAETLPEATDTVVVGALEAGDAAPAVPQALTASMAHMASGNTKERALQSFFMPLTLGRPAWNNLEGPRAAV
jgi:hypothetical protein